MRRLVLQVLSRVTAFVHELSSADQIKIAVDIESLCDRDFETVYIKTLRGPIKELIVKRVRIIFCVYGNTLYILHAFFKKSTKTPSKEIKIAEHLHGLLMKQLGPHN
ncbi:MAG: type II toxin-antitoxin system RelE/ParE family toxin [Candidatus Paceibacterota bacterium]|jgi:phage-related protein